MYKKTCPKCHQPSYSSSNTDRWICPTCSHDLTRVTSQDTETRKQNKPQLYVIKNSYIQENPQLKAKIRPYLFKSFD